MGNILLTSHNFLNRIEKRVFELEQEQREKIADILQEYDLDGINEQPDSFAVECAIEDIANYLEVNENCIYNVFSEFFELQD